MVTTRDGRRRRVPYGVAVQPDSEPIEVAKNRLRMTLLAARRARPESARQAARDAMSLHVRNPYATIDAQWQEGKGATLHEQAGADWLDTSVLLFFAQHLRGHTATTKRLGTKLTIVAKKRVAALEEARRIERALKRKKNPALAIYYLQE